MPRGARERRSERPAARQRVRPGMASADAFVPAINELAKDMDEAQEILGKLQEAFAEEADQAEAEAAAKPERLAAGQRVRVGGLAKAPQHNGRCGTVVSYSEEKGRHVVHLDVGLDATGQQLSLRLASLTKLTAAESKAEDDRLAMMTEVQAAEIRAKQQRGERQRKEELRRRWEASERKEAERRRKVEREAERAAQEERDQIVRKKLEQVRYEREEAARCGLLIEAETSFDKQLAAQQVMRASKM